MCDTCIYVSIGRLALISSERDIIKSPLLDVCMYISMIICTLINIRFGKCRKSGISIIVSKFYFHLSFDLFT